VLVIRTAVVGSASGLHARAAAALAWAAADQAVPVLVRTPGHPPVPADSVLGLLTLAANRGAELTLEADGVGAAAVLAVLAGLIESDLDAPMGAGGA
jgi:phosphocarrier protein HPr